MIERLRNVEMSKYTSFRAGGICENMLIAEDVDDLCQALKELKTKECKYVMLGNGSNTLFKDGIFHGTVVKLGDGFSEVLRDGDYITAGASSLMIHVARTALEASLTGFENLSGIPGSVGGAVFMNAGAYGSEMRDVVESVTLVSPDGESIRVAKLDELELGYRHSKLQETGEIIVSVTFKLCKGNYDEIEAKMKDVGNKRVSKQPLQYPSAGSFFKRPEGYFAGKLIEDAGLKGLSVGGAQISEMHAGFMINKGGATATDIIELMHLVQNTVYDKFKVKLEPEVRILGD